jgi:type IV pilus assembly protein PilM
MASVRVFAFDLGADHVSGGIFRKTRGGRLSLERFASERLRGELKDDAAWTEAAGSAVERVAASLRCRQPAVLAMPGHVALVRFVTTPSIGKAKLAKVVEFEAGQNIPLPLSEAAWDYEIVADEDADLRVMLAAARSATMEAVCAKANAAGLEVERMTPAAVSLRHAFCYNYPEIVGSSLVVGVGARSTHLILTEGSRFLARTVALGANVATFAIAEALRLEFAEAEDLKVRLLGGESDLPAESLVRAVGSRAEAELSARLEIEIVRTLAAFRRQTSIAEPTSVYVGGGGSLVENFPAMLERKLRVPVQRLDALRRVDVSMAAGAVAKELSPGLGDLVGLAASEQRTPASEINLLPARRKAARRFERRKPLLLAAAVFLVVALAAPWWYYHRAAVAAGQQIERLEARLKPLRILHRRMADQLTEIETANRQIDALSRLVEAKTGWLEFFADLQKRLGEVDDVWLDNFVVVRDGPVENAAAPSMKIALSGRLLDAENPIAKVSPKSFERVRRLLAGLATSRFVAAVEGERFDNRQPGILRFDVTIKVNPARL